MSYCGATIFGRICTQVIWFFECSEKPSTQFYGLGGSVVSGYIKGQGGVHLSEESPGILHLSHRINSSSFPKEMQSEVLEWECPFSVLSCVLFLCFCVRVWGGGGGASGYVPRIIFVFACQGLPRGGSNIQ